MPREVRLRRIGERLLSVKALHHLHEQGLAASDENVGFLADALCKRVEEHLLEEPRLAYRLVDESEVIGDREEPVLDDIRLTELREQTLRIDLSQRLQIVNAVNAIVGYAHGVSQYLMLSYREISLEVRLKDVCCLVGFS